MSMTPAAVSGLLRIDAARVAEAIKEYLRDVTARRSADGVLLGLSGGLDSAVLATLAVGALGREFVHVAYLYDRDSDRTLRLRARQVADWLGLQLETIDIEPAMREKGVYAPLLMRIASWSPVLNRSVHRLYRSVFRQTMFMASLRESAARFPESAFNARHIHRRELLENKAEARNWLLLGAANNSEWLVGWFVKGGIDDLPIQPIRGLYKTQVRQLASFLGVPEEIRVQAPSPDMMKEITDEFALGISYAKLDLALDCLEGGVSEEALLANGITKGELDLASEMKRLSYWKREPAQPPPPVSGTIAGGFRTAGDSR